MASNLFIFPRHTPRIVHEYEQSIRYWHLYQIVDQVYTGCTGSFDAAINGSGKETVMRYKDAIITAIALVLSLLTLTGMAYTDQFQQAAVTESAGFDALAHNLFDGAKMACADGPDGADAAEGRAQ
jgi:hypothetical protein